MPTARDPEGSGSRIVQTRQTASQRRRWSREELRYLDTWAGTRPLAELSWLMQRSERSLRCKMHRLGLSARVREGWDLRQLKTTLGMDRAAALHGLETGALRIHSAQIRLRPSVSWQMMGMRAAEPSPDRHMALRKLAREAHRPLRALATRAARGLCRLAYLRFTEASIRGIARRPDIRQRLNQAMARWLLDGTEIGSRSLDFAR